MSLCSPYATRNAKPAMLYGSALSTTIGSVPVYRRAPRPRPCVFRALSSARPRCASRAVITPVAMMFSAMVVV